MDFPHRHGHGHGRRDDDDEDRRAPAPYGRHEPDAYGAPPPSYGRRPDDDAGDAYGRHPPAAYGAPPPAYGAPPPAYGGGREDEYGGRAPAYGAPAPAYGGGREDDYGRHAPAPAGYGGGDYGRHAPAPAYGGGRDEGYGAPAHGNVVHVSHESGDERPQYGGYGHETRPHHGGGGMAPPATRQPTYRILCKAGEDSFSLAARDGKVCLVRTDRDDDTQVHTHNTSARSIEDRPHMLP
uniref:Uncharacterized protein n=1 Tax=Aegilops tauschii subsp. strangulata TaxID=200361 RepID=A0A453E010_AEGTS